MARQGKSLTYQNLIDEVSPERRVHAHQELKQLSSRCHDAFGQALAIRVKPACASPDPRCP